MMIMMIMVIIIIIMKMNWIEGGRLAASSLRSVRTSIAVSLIDLKLARVIIKMIMMVLLTISFQLMAVTASAYLVAWGPFSVLCIWEMVVQPKVLINHDHDHIWDIHSQREPWTILNLSHLTPNANTLIQAISCQNLNQKLLSRPSQGNIGSLRDFLPSPPQQSIPSSTSSCRPGSGETPATSCTGRSLFLTLFTTLANARWPKVQFTGPPVNDFWSLNDCC